MVIVTKRAGVCRACGGPVRKGEYAEFAAAEGLAHVEPQCAQGPVRYRPNARAGQCTCGTHVPAREGRLRLIEDTGATGGGKRWAVDCSRCAGLSR